MEIARKFGLKSGANACVNSSGLIVPIPSHVDGLGVRVPAPATHSRHVFNRTDGGERRTSCAERLGWGIGNDATQSLLRTSIFIARVSACKDLLLRPRLDRSSRGYKRDSARTRTEPPAGIMT